MNTTEWVAMGVIVLLAFLCISAFLSSDVRKRGR